MADFQGHAEKRISFVLVTLNRVAFMRTALQEAQSIVGPDDELIVIDGGSTDGTRELVEDYPGLVDIFISEPDVGPTDAFNKGLLIARGRYIKQLTDDDTYFHDAIEAAAKILDEQRGIDLLVCGGTRQLGDERTNVYVPPGSNFGASPEDLFRFGTSGCGFMYRRSSLSRTGLLNPMGVATDGEYLVQAIANKANVKFCRINMFHHPLFEHSFVIKHERDHASDMLRIAKKYCSRAFYFRYKAKMLALRVAPMRVIGRGGKVLFKLITRRRASHQSNDVAKTIWDGGFS